MYATVVHEENGVRCREWLHPWKELTSQKVKKKCHHLQTLHVLTSTANISVDDIAAIALYLLPRENAVVHWSDSSQCISIFANMSSLVSACFINPDQTFTIKKYCVCHEVPSQ